MGAGSSFVLRSAGLGRVLCFYSPLSLRFEQTPLAFSSSQDAVTWRRWLIGVSPSFPDTVLPYH